MFGNMAANAELWVVITTVLLVVKYILDSLGPWYSNKFIFMILQSWENLNNSMVHYILGIMPHMSHSKHDFFQVWAVLVVTLQYSIKVGRPYGRYKKLTLSDMLSSLWAANLLRSETPMFLAIPLWLIWSLNAARMIGYFLASDSASRINHANLRLVTDYMKYEHKLSDPVATNPVTMSGYKYLVYGEEKQVMEVRAPKFGFELDMKHEKLITTESVWNHQEDGLLGKREEASRFKDVCLSFALYKMLRRRFYNLPLHEEGHEKTRGIILDGILQGSNEESYERAFRITEVELSFLRDYFHGNHAVMFVNGFPFRRLVLSGLLVAALLSVGYPVYHIHSTTSGADAVARRNGLLVSYGIILLIIGKEFWEIYVYVLSQWTKIWMVCSYISVKKLQCSLMQKAVRLIFKLTTRGQWDQKLGQYNLLIDCPVVKLVFSQLRPTTIKLQMEVKKAIFERFTGLEKPERLGSYFSDAFGSNGVPENFSWVNELESDTHRILVWHIATCLCEIELCGEEAARALKPFWLRPRVFAERSRATTEDTWKNYVVAVTLSNYCAYLITRFPRLVPDNRLVSFQVFHAVRREVHNSTFWHFRSLKKIHSRLLGKPAALDGNRHATVKMGALLAQQMLETYRENSAADAWEILAKFWAGFLLHLAACTRASRHKVHLQGQGELITHLWALLSHAGFTGINRDDELRGLGADGIEDEYEEQEQ